MNYRRSCRVIIQAPTRLTTRPSILNALSNSLLCIKDQKERKIKQIPFQQCAGTRLDVEAEQRFQISFALQSLQSEQQFASGQLCVQLYQISDDQIFLVNCPINYRKTGEQIAIIKMELSLDDQKVGCNIDAMDSINNSVTQQWPQISSQKITGKTTRKRKHAYFMRNENPKIKVNNKIINNANIVLKDFILQLDNAVESIYFEDQKSKQFIGQILCFNGPSIQQLKNCQIKVPIQFTLIRVTVKTIQNQIFHAEVGFNILPQEEPRNVKAGLWDGDGIEQGFLRISYKTSSDEQQISNQRLQMNTQEIEKHQSLIHPNILQYLHGHSPPKPPRNKLSIPHPLNSNMRLVSGTVAYKITPFMAKKQNTKIETIDVSRPINYNRELYYHEDKFQSLPKMGQSYVRYPSIFQYRKNGLEDSWRKHEQYTVKISSVNINLYSSFIMKYKMNSSRDDNFGKFLQIYSKPSHILRSDPIFTSQSLSWKLAGYQVDMKRKHNLTIELYLSRERSVVGEAIISFSRLEQSLEQFNYYLGHITFNGEQIGKIVLNYSITLKPQSYVESERQSSLEKINKINQRLRLGLPHRQSLMQIRQPRFDTPSREPKFRTLQDIPQIPSKKKKRKIIVYRQ